MKHFHNLKPKLTIRTVNIILSSSKVTLLQETVTSQIIRATQLKVQIYEIGDTVEVREKKIFLNSNPHLPRGYFEFPKINNLTTEALIFNNLVFLHFWQTSASIINIFI